MLHQKSAESVDDYDDVYLRQVLWVVMKTFVGEVKARAAKLGQSIILTISIKNIDFNKLWL